MIGKPYSVICADRGRQTVKAGKGRSLTSTGLDADRIILHPSSNKNIVHAGLGNDFVQGSNGHDVIYASPKKNPRQLPDRDVVYGGGGNDRIYDYSGEGNRLYGESGADRIYSLGNSVSTINGGDGSDYLYSNGGKTSTGRTERIFGERGNDKLFGDRRPSNGPAFFDGGSGDDWVHGTPNNDTIIFHSGITKIKAKGGNDLIISTSRGAATIDGGAGRDTISFAAHTPPGRNSEGVTVDLPRSTSKGAKRQSVKNVENVIGSAFDDVLIGQRGVKNHLDGGLGNDTLIGQARDGDTAQGGLGRNSCDGFRKTVNCDQDSPGEPGKGKAVVDINEGGVLTVIGSNQADRISVGYDRLTARYRVKLGRAGVASGLCNALSGGGKTVSCRADRNNLNGILIYGHAGNDRIKVKKSVPAGVTATINGGTGKNVLTGGKKAKNYMSTAEGASAGSVLRGDDNVDVIYINDNVRVSGGKGSDAIHIQNVCRGGFAKGGAGGKDNLIFAGALRGVDADLSRGTVRWVRGGCRKPFRFKRDFEALEGSKHADRLKLGPRLKGQGPKRSLLGRDGADVLHSRNGVRDTVTTGGDARRTKVIADRFDKVTRGWGHAAY